MPRPYFVYILSNQSRCYYVGVTNNLYRRWLEHRTGGGSGFCRQHHLTRLVYAETHYSPGEAIAREKQLKRWRRAQKRALIETLNPGRLDLAIEWGWRARPSSSVVLGERIAGRERS